ncbi:glycosyltransferase family 9 protein [Fluviicola taffensis]|uniref:Glycosyl transferase family 9 n=1 Tax=Fluviicola taffensis (strain DSM 16823 / NCIMB 13979 / RW262) TaxID=755732 RepID=F2IED7_FLUTR|nr:glycosyltransferase family 9 protein [Fluviicola taffensis]AEA43461.1 glycosyl transferase family 9 [Fluviicola taffensis DSM 16823]
MKEETKDWNGKHIAISRTDSIGDVLLTLPITAWLKEKYPTCKITFFCRNYTAPIVKHYESVDDIVKIDDLLTLPKKEQIDAIESLNLDAVVHVFPKKELAKLFKKALVPTRIGTSHRLFHLNTCNIRPNFTRKKSPLHESQLNFELIRPFGLSQIPSLEEVSKYTSSFGSEKEELPPEFDSLIGKKYVILHPKSQGSAREWPIEKYIELAKQLIVKDYEVVFTGTEQEGKLFRKEIPTDASSYDSTGKLNIDQLIWLIKNASGLVACSTGPLHIAGFLNTKAIGLFSPRIPIHPGRWKPLGKHSTPLIFDSNCEKCMAKKECDCISSISVETVLNEILK